MHILYIFLNLLLKLLPKKKFAYYSLDFFPPRPYWFPRMYGLWGPKKNFLLYKLCAQYYVQCYMNLSNAEFKKSIDEKEGNAAKFIQLFIVTRPLEFFFIKLKNVVDLVWVNLCSTLYLLFQAFRWPLLSLFIAGIYFFISLFYIQLDFAKQLVVWYLLFVSYYLLLSGFNSFLVKYRYGKFTAAIQRFWKRTGIIFWLIEGFLFLIFFYYFLNSSQEQLYMFDYSALNKEFVVQLKISYKNLLLVSLATYLGFVLLLKVNVYTYYQNLTIVCVITLIVFYTLYVETYQFIYVVSLFADKDWVFDDADQTWVLTAEESNLRVKQYYFILCLIAKYWHFIFIFIGWFFFLVKSLEASKVSITLLGYNTQNLLILYVLNLVCLVQWFKILTKKFVEITYSWFHTQYDDKFTLTLVREFWNTLIYFFRPNVGINSLGEFVYIFNIFFCSDAALWKII